MGCGDAVIGVNPATDSVQTAHTLLDLMDELRRRWAIPTQTCVLTHITNTIELIELGAPVDLALPVHRGDQAANRGFGVDLAACARATRRPWR